MPKVIILYVRAIEKINQAVGKLTMYMIFAMMGILLFESISRTAVNQAHIWVVEIAQFMMAAYYLLGGGYSMIHKGHVRMDLLYGRWTPRTRAIVDTITGPILIFYLVFLLFGAMSSIDYAITFNQRNYTPWAPPLAPIKIIMATGIVLMLLQAFAMFFRDLAKAIGKEIV